MNTKSDLYGYLKNQCLIRKIKSMSIETIEKHILQCERLIESNLYDLTYTYADENFNIWLKKETAQSIFDRIDKLVNYQMQLERFEKK